MLNTPMARDRDRDRSYGDGEHEIARLGAVIATLRNELDTSVRAQQASTRKISNIQEEIEIKNDEIMKLKNHVDNFKNDNRRLTQELRSLKDDNDYVNKYDYNNLKLENESLKVNNKNLKNNIETLINDQQREKFASNLEIDNLKGERTRLVCRCVFTYIFTYLHTHKCKFLHIYLYICSYKCILRLNPQLSSNELSPGVEVYTYKHVYTFIHPSIYMYSYIRSYKCIFRLNAQLSSNELSPGVEIGKNKLAEYAVLLEGM
jgi:hypothetical protein